MGGGREGRLESGLTCVGCAVTVGLCDLALLKVLMRPDGVEDVRGTHDVVSPTSRTHPPPPSPSPAGVAAVGAAAARRRVSMPARYPVSLTWPEVIKVVRLVKLVKLEQGSEPEEGQAALGRACRM